MLCELRPIYKCDRLRANVRRQTCRRDEIRFSNLGGGARWEKLNPWRQPPAAHARLRKKAFYAQIDNFYIYRFAGTLKAFMYKLPEIMTLAGKHNLRSSAESECKISKPLWCLPRTSRSTESDSGGCDKYIICFWLSVAAPSGDIKCFLEMRARAVLIWIWKWPLMRQYISRLVPKRKH